MVLMLQTVMFYFGPKFIFDVMLLFVIGQGSNYHCTFLFLDCKNWSSLHFRLLPEKQLWLFILSSISTNVCKSRIRI